MLITSRVAYVEGRYNVILNFSESSGAPSFWQRAILRTPFSLEIRVIIFFQELRSYIAGLNLPYEKRELTFHIDK